MAVYLITYDLNSPGQDYESLFEEIKSIGPWAKYMRSVWFVESSLGSTAIRDRLVKVIDDGDTLFVCRVTEDSAWYLDTKFNDWINPRV